MATARINFGNSQASGDAELAGASPRAVNVVVDGHGAVRRRPGISAWDGFPSSIPEASQVDGIGSFKGEVYYVTAARRIHKVTAAAADVLLTTPGDPATHLAGAARPVFAETKFRLAIAGGDVPQKVNAGATVSARLGGSPPKSTHIAALASRLFSNDKTGTASIGQIRFSSTGTTGEELWDPLNEVEAEARPDDIVALRENTNEMFGLGETTLQVFTPDGSAILAPGRTKNIGCTAPYSVIRIDENLAWFDNQRRFVLSDGRTYQDLSADLGRTIDGITTVSDCYGFRFNFDQFDCLTWLLPTDGRAFSWQNGGGWAQWHGWDAARGVYIPLMVKSHYLWETANVHLVGLASGQIAKFDTAAATDLGAIIKAEVVTGADGHETDAYKQCECLRLTLVRGQASTEAFIRISWRDDGGAFCTPISLSLGTLGNYEQSVELRGLGMYRRRQWKFEMTDAAELVLAGAEETYTVGGAN